MCNILLNGLCEKKFCWGLFAVFRYSTSQVLKFNFFDAIAKSRVPVIGSRADIASGIPLQVFDLV
ncbi:MAG: hypothetical protein A2505_06090 [Deltaproteobacteria bacterium RIFOXYD12_FULL_55_16]|nr:MAG: hypothetical protein A2505_06090 [Deltaproteobacteria bacterium RIFOXYD12_FULL_55_16]